MHQAKTAVIKIGNKKYNAACTLKFFFMPKHDPTWAPSCRGSVPPSNTGTHTDQPRYNGNKLSLRGRQDNMPTRGRSMSVCRTAAGSQHADNPGSCAMQPACYSLGWDRRTNCGIA